VVYSPNYIELGWTLDVGPSFSYKNPHIPLEGAGPSVSCFRLIQAVVSHNEPDGKEAVHAKPHQRAGKLRSVPCRPLISEAHGQQKGTVIYRIRRQKLLYSMLSRNAGDMYYRPKVSNYTITRAPGIPISTGRQTRTLPKKE